MDLGELMGWEGVNWMYLDQDGNQWGAFVSAVKSFWIP
jgi:hypothetical protein